MGHLSLDFHGVWLESSGGERGTWTHVLTHRGWRCGSHSASSGLTCAHTDTVTSHNSKLDSETCAR
eukprot:1723600-Prymnesium_polylepis.1